MDVTLRIRSCYFLDETNVILQMFDWLSGNKKGFITKDDVSNFSRDEMRALVLEFEGTDVSNTEEAEYGVIDVSQVR